MDNKESSKAMRSKEDAQDYRYFPDPDLVPVVISDQWIARVKARQPELRTEKIARYKEEYGLPEYDPGFSPVPSTWRTSSRRPPA